MLTYRYLERFTVDAVNVTMPSPTDSKHFCLLSKINTHLRVKIICFNCKMYFIKLYSR